MLHWKYIGYCGLSRELYSSGTTVGFIVEMTLNWWEVKEALPHARTSYKQPPPFRGTQHHNLLPHLRLRLNYHPPPKHTHIPTTGYFSEVLNSWTIMSNFIEIAFLLEDKLEKLSVLLAKSYGGLDEGGYGGGEKLIGLGSI